MQRILVTGANGLVGKYLVQMLLMKGFQVCTLTRSLLKIDNVDSYLWNPDSNEIDLMSLQSAQGIVHLAGENLAGERWTIKRKQKIINSRVNSTRLLFESLKKLDKKPECFITASAIGIYGANTGSQWLNENSPIGTDFLAEVTKRWENEADQISLLGIRVVKVRMGIVLSRNGGALEKMSLPIKYGIGAPLGSGNQGISWIHIEDLANFCIYTLVNRNLEGVYNTVSPSSVSNKEFMLLLAKIMHKPFFLPNVHPLYFTYYWGKWPPWWLVGALSVPEKFWISVLYLNMEN